MLIVIRLVIIYLFNKTFALEYFNASYGEYRRTFFNDGRMYGWDKKHHEADGTVDEVKTKDVPGGCFNNQIDSDAHCLKFTQTYNPEYGGRYHAEVIFENATKLGVTSYYGMAFKLADDWEFTDESKYGPKVMNNRVTILQFITNFKDVNCGTNHKGAVPSTMFWLQGDMLYSRVRMGTPCKDGLDQRMEFKVGKVMPGVWHALVFGAHWSKRDDGWFTVWLDRKLRIDKMNIPTFMKVDHRLFQFRVGMYPNWWTWDHSGHPFIKPEHQKKKVIYIDSIGYGPSITDADPWFSELSREKYNQPEKARIKNS